MRLPKCLDRERRIRAVEILLGEKAEDCRLYFGLWQNAAKQIEIARTERDNTRADLVQRDAEIVALKRQVASTQLRLRHALQDSWDLREQLDKYEQGAIPL